jgi:MFS family permease
LKPLHIAIAYILLNHVPFTAMRLAVSLYALHLNASPAVVGAIVALFSALPMLGSMHLGRLIDRKGVRMTLLVASAVLGCASLLAVLWPSVTVLFFVSGLGGGAYITILIAGQQLVGRYGGPSARVANFSALSTAFALSLAAVPMATGFVIEHIGFGVTFMIMTVMPPLAMLIIFFNKLPDLGPVAPDGRQPASSGQPSASTGRHTGSAQAMDLVRNPGLLQLYAYSILFTVSWDLFLFMAPIYCTQLQLPASQTGIVVGSFSVAMFVVRLAARPLAEKFSSRQLLLLCLSGAGVGALGFGFADSLPLLLLFALIMGRGQGLANPTMNALLYDTSPPERIAEAMGLRTSIAKACQVVLPLLAGSASVAFGAAPIFWVIAVLQLGAVVRARGQWRVRPS